MIATTFMIPELLSGNPELLALKVCENDEKPITRSVEYGRDQISVNYLLVFYVTVVVWCIDTVYE